MAAQGLQRRGPLAFVWASKRGAWDSLNRTCSGLASGGMGPKYFIGCACLNRLFLLSILFPLSFLQLLAFYSPHRGNFRF